jgi:hypothetical protein
MIISLFKVLFIKIKIHLIRFGMIHKKFGNNIMIINVLIQFNSRFIIIVVGSKILKRFIIIFYF